MITGTTMENLTVAESVVDMTATIDFTETTTTTMGITGTATDTMTTMTTMMIPTGTDSLAEPKDGSNQEDSDLFPDLTEEVDLQDAKDKTRGVHSRPNLSEV